MARKTKEDAEQTHTALLDAAEQVFYEHGVAQTTLNDIAIAAGMTRGAIYGTSRTKLPCCRPCLIGRCCPWRPC